MPAERHTFIVRLSRDGATGAKARWRGTVQHVQTRTEQSVQTVAEVQRVINRGLQSQLGLRETDESGEDPDDEDL